MSNPFRVKITHTPHGFDLMIPDADAQQFNMRYEVARIADSQVVIRPTQHKGRRRGVRPGALRTRKMEPVRYMQFDPIPDVPQFGMVECVVSASSSRHEFMVIIPNELPPVPVRKSSPHKNHSSPTPNADPIPAPAPSEIELPSEEMPTLPGFTEATVGFRISIRDAVRRVNAFLAEVDGAEAEIFVENDLHQKIRISVVETYE